MSPRVVVTGSEGFVGGATIPVLEAHGFKVIRFDKKLGQDICNPSDLRDVLRPGDRVLNLAAVARFKSCDEDPPEAYRTNTGGVAMLTQVAEELRVERVVHASTASVYMPVWQAPISEHHPKGGNSHYGVSKYLGEKMFGLHQKVPFVILRYAHLYGPGKQSGGLIDTFVDRIQRGAAPILYGGAQSNDFTYIVDVARANLAALLTEHVNEDYNVGTGEETTTEGALELLSKLTHYTGPIDRQAMRAVDAPKFVLSVDKARRLLGWKPLWDFQTGLTETLKLVKFDT